MDKATQHGIERQLKDLLRFQNALIEAAEPPNDLTPEQLLPWFVERLKMADVGDYETAMKDSREQSIRAEATRTEREAIAAWAENKCNLVPATGRDFAAAIRARTATQAEGGWKQTVRDIYDLCSLGDPRPTQIVALIEKRHADYFDTPRATTQPPATQAEGE